MVGSTYATRRKQPSDPEPGEGAVIPGRFQIGCIFLLSLALSTCTLTHERPLETTALFKTVAVATESTSSMTELKPGDPSAIFYNGTILTMDENQRVAEAIAVEGDWIKAVGREQEILALQAQGTELINLEGRVLMPGFVDTHNHVFNDAVIMGNSLSQAQELALMHGVTAMGNLFTTSAFLEEMRTFDAEGSLHIRTNLYLVYNTNCGEVIGEWYLDDPALPLVDDSSLLRADGVKVFSDGGTCDRGPALSFEVMPGAGYGDLFVTGEELVRVIQHAQGAGFQVAIHAIGDRALDVVLDALQAVLDGESNPGRHRIEHNAVVRPDQLPRYRGLDIIATIRGTYPSCEPFGPPLPAAYQSWEWPVNPLMEAYPGGHIAYHSDYPYHSINPFHHLFGFVTRNDVGKLGQICQPFDYLAKDTIPVEQGMRMMTTEAAYALFREDEIGSLETGKAADMIILNADPRAVDPFDIPKIDVLMTMVAGQVHWCTRTYDRLCPGW